MQITELCLEILNRYPQEYARDKKLSNPIVAELKSKIAETFAELASEYDFEAVGPGGQGLMRKEPYVVMAIRPHHVNKGIYPSLSFQTGAEKVRLGIGDAYDNPPPADLAEGFAKRAWELLPGFPDRNEDSYPSKTYTREQLQEEVLLSDIRQLLDVHTSCLIEFSDEITEYLESAGESTEQRLEKEPAGGAVLSTQAIQQLIDEFLRWYPGSERQAEEGLDEYSRFTKPYFENLSDKDLAKVT